MLSKILVIFLKSREELPSSIIIIENSFLMIANVDETRVIALVVHVSLLKLYIGELTNLNTDLIF